LQLDIFNLNNPKLFRLIFKVRFNFVSDCQAANARNWIILAINVYFNVD